MQEFTGSLLGRIALRFQGRHARAAEDLSAALRTPSGGLLVASDERASLELLTPEPARPNVLSEHQSFALHEALGLQPDEEVDIEGMAGADDDCSALFVIGSHSAKRKKPRGKDDQKDLQRLARVEVNTAREVLAYIPMRDGVPVIDGKVARLASDRDDSLLAMLADDPHLGTFVARDERYTVPGKDNGFDIEGLASANGRLMLGLRGPVLRGYAFVLSISVEVQGSDLAIVGKKRKYRKHALDLDGLGVRELLVHGDDMLVLAGPTMALDGAHRLFRWVGGAHPSDDGIVAQGKGKGELQHLFDIPFHRGFDRAEGICRWSWFGQDDSLLVVYDAPGAARKLADGTLLADVFALPRR